MSRLIGADLVALTRAQWKGFWREKQNWFWMLAFPLMFLFLFGFLFRDAGASRTDIALVGDVQFVQQMPADARKQFDELFETATYDDRDAAIAEVRKGDLDGALVQEAPGELRLYYSAADQVTSATVRGTMQGFVDGANLAQLQQEPAFSLTVDQVEDDSLEPIQFMAPGLLGWAVAMGGVFNTAMPLVTWRTNKLLRRLRLAPVRTSNLVLSRTVVGLAVALLQTVIFLGLGVLVFGLELSGWWLLSIPLLMVATVAFMAIGMVAGAVSKTAEGASGLANVIILPMAFLSGSFIPLEGAPGWMQATAEALPLGQLNEGMLDVMVRGEGPSALVVPTLVLIAFGVVFAAIAAKLFRWDD
jgi:ABC-2 type transport system permease protein